jgi:cobalt-zinc-cadmium efflux system outer membrane protein
MWLVCACRAGTHMSRRYGWEVFMAKVSPGVLARASALLVCVAAPSLAQTEVTLTLDQALTEALAQSPALAVERNEIGIAAGALRQARVFPLNPELALEGTTGRAHGRGGDDERRDIDGKGVGVSQVIWLRGQRGLRVRAAEAGMDHATTAVRDADAQPLDRYQQ